MRRLQSYEWPGNVRELQNVIERAVVLNKTGVIKLADLPDPSEEALRDAILDLVRTPLADRLWYVADGLRVGRKRGTRAA